MSDPFRKRTEVEVRYAETDQMGHVHHAVHLVWFELARTQLCSEAGFHYSEVEDMGFFMLVTGVEARYVRPIYYGRPVTVDAWIEQLASRKIRFAYEIRQDDQIAARGATEHIWFDRQSRRPCRTPETLREAFSGLAEGRLAQP